MIAKNVLIIWGAMLGSIQAQSPFNSKAGDSKTMLWLIGGAGFSTYSSDTLGSGVSLGLSVYERMHGSWWIGINIGYYKRTKSRILRIGFPEIHILDDCLEMFPFLLTISEGKEYPLFTLGLGGFYIRGRTVKAGWVPSPYGVIVTKIEKIRPGIELTLSGTQMLFMTSFGVTMRVTGGFILDQGLFGDIGFGISRRYK